MWSSTSRDDVDIDKVYSTKGRGETFAAILERRLNRRRLIGGGVAAAALVLTEPRIGGVAAQEATPVSGASPAATPGAGSTLTFTPIGLSTLDQLEVPAGYQALPFLRWGDPITADAPDFDPENQSAAAQELQFGYNCDFVGFLPLPVGSDSSDNGLLVVNHEYTNPELMFMGYQTPNPATPEGGGTPEPEFLTNVTREIVDVELAAHGMSVVEILRNGAGEWTVVRDSQYNRRLTGTTPMELTGPVAGADLAKTADDPTGITVLGTLNNCAAGITPWGTVLSGEENFNQYFGNVGSLAEDDPIRAHHDRIGIPEGGSERQWERFYDRFDVSKEPNEAFRFGWTVEIDPYEPTSTPKKRTAIGRFKHEAISSVIAPAGNVVFYSGDDQIFEYIYKFVSTGTFDPDDRAANADLLDDGTLYVARFNDDGAGEWLPLVYGEGALTEANGFTSQVDILLNTRSAGDVVGATKMDRPEDIEPNPINGRVYINCTNNDKRGTAEGEEGANPANPRPENLHGQVIELIEDGGDHASLTFTWDLFIICGEPSDESTYFGGYPKDKVSAISSPDNMTFDLDGNLWLSTDGQPSKLNVNDGLFAVPVDGPERGYLRQFFSAVPGAEVSGPIFTPDNTSLFVAVQHPGEGGTLEAPRSRWPDDTNMPRPSVVVIRAENGGRIGE